MMRILPKQGVFVVHKTIRLFCTESSTLIVFSCRTILNSKSNRRSSFAVHTLILISPRTEVSFGRLYSTVCKESENLTSKRTPNRINSGTPTHWYPDTKDRYRHIYFKALELATREIKRRFDQEDLYVVIREIENLKFTELFYTRY